MVQAAAMRYRLNNLTTLMDWPLPYESLGDVLRELADKTVLIIRTDNWQSPRICIGYRRDGPCNTPKNLLVKC